MHRFKDNAEIPISTSQGITPAPPPVKNGRLERRMAFSAFLFIIGTIFGVFLVSLPIRGRVPGGISWQELLQLPGIGSLTWYACLLSSPLYVWLARRLPIFERPWGRNFGLHFLITTALVILTGVIYFQLMSGPTNNVPAGNGDSATVTPETSGQKNNAGQPSVPARPGFRGDLGGFLALRLLTESLPFWAMIALIHAFEFHRRYRQRDVETALLKAQLTESRLEALTAQLHPHFLFNTLQGISTLMHRDVQAADEMLSRLSELLRHTLQRGDRQEVTLGEELKLLENYVGISRERFKDRLIFEIGVEDNLLNALVPFFILQPLVENALQHGIARRPGAGRVTIGAERQSDILHLWVTDDGPGISNEARDFPREGIGLGNTRQRLDKLYGNRQRLEIKTPTAGGLRVELTIPYRVSPEPERKESDL